MSPALLLGGLLAVVILCGGVFVAMLRSSPASTGLPATPVAPLAGSQLPPTPPVQRAAPAIVAQGGGLLTAATSGHAPYPQVAAEEGALRWSVSIFDDYEAHYYTYMHAGRPIEFFVLKTQDGVIRSAFNACLVCFDSLRGFRHEGDEMVCNNCGQRFPTSQIDEVEGEYNPVPLQRTVIQNTLIIEVADVVNGAQFFAPGSTAQAITIPTAEQPAPPASSPGLSAAVPSETPSPTPGPAVAEAPVSSDGVKRISPSDAKALIDRGEAVLYDIRLPDEYQDKHALGATSFPEQDMELLLDALPSDKVLIFYCT